MDARTGRDVATEGVIVSRAVVRAAHHLGLNNAAIAAVVGLSEPTISRMASGGYSLVTGSKPYELAVLLIRLFRGLDAIVGGESQPMQSWMRSPNTALDGIPAQQVRTVAGLVCAVDYVDSFRARI